MFTHQFEAIKLSWYINILSYYYYYHHHHLLYTGYLYLYS